MFILKVNMFVSKSLQASWSRLFPTQYMWQKKRCIPAHGLTFALRQNTEVSLQRMCFRFNKRTIRTSAHPGNSEREQFVDYSVEENNPNYGLRVNVPRNFTHEQIPLDIEAISKQNKALVQIVQGLKGYWEKAKVTKQVKSYMCPMILNKLMGALRKHMKSTKGKALDQQTNHEIFNFATAVFMEDYVRGSHACVNYLKILMELRRDHEFRALFDALEKKIENETWTYLHPHFEYCFIEFLCRRGLFGEAFKRLIKIGNSSEDDMTIFANYFLANLSNNCSSNADRLKYINEIVGQGLGHTQGPFNGKIVVDEYTFNIMLKSVSQLESGSHEACWNVLSNMEEHGFTPSSKTLMFIIDSLGSDQLMRLEKIFNYFLDARYNVDIGCYKHALNRCLRLKRFDYGVYLYEKLVEEVGITPDSGLKMAYFECIVNDRVAKAKSERGKNALYEDDVKFILSYSSASECLISRDLMNVILDRISPKAEFACAELITDYVHSAYHSGTIYSSLNICKLMKIYLKRLNFAKALDIFGLCDAKRFDSNYMGFSALLKAFMEVGYTNGCNEVLRHMLKCRLKVERREMVQLANHIDRPDVLLQFLMLFWEHKKMSPWNVVKQIPHETRHNLLIRCVEFSVREEKEGVFSEMKEKLNTEDVCKIWEKKAVDPFGKENTNADSYMICVSAIEHFVKKFVNTDFKNKHPDFETGVKQSLRRVLLEGIDDLSFLEDEDVKAPRVDRMVATLLEKKLASNAGGGYDMSDSKAVDAILDSPNAPFVENEKDFLKNGNFSGRK